MRISKPYLLIFFWLASAWGGAFIPIACTNTGSNFNPTSPSTPVVPSATATNEFGFTSTATFTIQPTGTPTTTPTLAPLMSNPVTICTPNAPNGVAVNSAGTTLYVAGGDGYVSIYTVSLNTGTLLNSYNSYGSTQFGSLNAVALDATNGNYYVVDNGTNAVYELNPAGAAQATWNNYSGMPFNSPQGIAVDSSENVYVVDTGNNVIDEFTANGAATVNQWGYAGNGNGNFNSPTGIAIGTNSPVTLYVADMGNELIQEFTLAGVFINQFATLPNPDIDLAVAVDNGGNVFAADYNNSIIEDYDSMSSPVTLNAQWDGPFPTPTYNFGPDGVAVNSAGTTLYVADYDNNAIYRVNP